MKIEDNKNYLYDSTKYFPTPIEDIRIGYECEILEGFNWNKYIVPNPKKGIQEDNIIYQKILHYTGIEKELIRTQYLTKEQIENEGWKPNGIGGIHDGIHFKKSDTIGLNFDASNHSIQIYQVNAIIDWNLYFGECRSVNELRYITKLLKI